jgi:hypothetical protein
LFFLAEASIDGGRQTDLRAESESEAESATKDSAGRELRGE